MAVCYLAHAYGGDKTNIERVGKIAKKLQLEHPEHAFFSPLHALSYLEYNEMAYDDLMEVCCDFLSACDVLIVIGEISKGVQREIDFAKLVKMEVLQLDENGKLRPFTE